jgi:glycosyltransferase involved in cell wall biosynthesis
MPKLIVTAKRPDSGQRIALSAIHGTTLVNDDMPLIARLLESGNHVLCLAPNISEAETLTLTHAGADVRQLDLAADRWALMRDRKVLQRATSVLSEWKANIVLARGAGVMPLLALAAQKAGAAQIVALVEHPPPDPDSGEELEGDTEESLIKAFDAVTDVLCANYDHAAQLEVSGLLPEELTPVVLPGLGVDLDQHQVAPLPPVEEGLSFLMIGELAVSRGVLDFCNAAKIVKERVPKATFQLAGSASRAADALSLLDLEPFSNSVSYVGDAADVSPLITQCHVFVYPSHGEAVPGMALQALAMGRPLITTDVPGCRELVDECVNGVFCAPGDPTALADAMHRLLKRPDLIPAMARASRQKAERRYDRRLVLAALFDLLGLKRAAITEA